MTGRSQQQLGGGGVEKLWPPPSSNVDVACSPISGTATASCRCPRREPPVLPHRRSTLFLFLLPLPLRVLLPPFHIVIGLLRHPSWSPWPRPLPTGRRGGGGGGVGLSQGVLCCSSSPFRNLSPFHTRRRSPVIRCLEKTRTFSPSSALRLWWLFAAILPCVIHVGLLKVEAFTGTYGINYGRIADNIPPPESVVKLLKEAKIKNVRIYDTDPSVLQAFKKSGLELVVGLPNGRLKNISGSEDQAMNWLKENVLPFLPDTQIRGIAVGNEVLAGPDQELQDALLGACKNVYSALDKLQLADLIQVWTAHSQAVFVNSFPPSSCTFKADILQYMKPLLSFFSVIGSPFFVNVYPSLAYKSDPEHIDVKYALFEPNSGVYDAKTNLYYDNMFDAEIDATYAALESLGFDKMKVQVSETGWASNGDKDEAGATAENAKTYNYNLRKRLFKKKGTPWKPKRVVKAYIFALFNENLKPGPGTEKHYGLFNANGSIAYDIGILHTKA